MIKILYVEDNFQNYRLVMRMLQAERNGYVISRAEDGASALKLAAELKPSLILMDINLPDIDGMEVTRRIKADPALKHIPVVALTANAMVGDRERYLAGGCDGYLRKPIARAELRAALEEFAVGTPGDQPDGTLSNPAAQQPAANPNGHRASEAASEPAATPSERPDSPAGSQAVADASAAGS